MSKLYKRINRIKSDIDEYEFKISMLHEDVDILLKKAEECQNKIYLYDDWMSENGYQENGRGYFNCLPDEIMLLILGYVPRHNLFRTCKNMKYLLHNKFKEHAIKKIGNCYKYLEDVHHNNYAKWLSVIKSIDVNMSVNKMTFGTNSPSLVICDGYVIETIIREYIVSCKVYNYTDREWMYHDTYCYANSKGSVILYHGDSITVIVSGVVYLFKLLDKFTSKVDGKTVYFPKCEGYGRQIIFMQMVDDGKIYSEYKHELKLCRWNGAPLPLINKMMYQSFDM